MVLDTYDYLKWKTQFSGHIFAKLVNVYQMHGIVSTTKEEIKN